jgi:hypothetical protein
MSFYRVTPIAAPISDAVRSQLKSPQYGHPAHVETATGSGPCRSCLKTFDIGQEDRILFTYNPFDGLADYPSPGPVFIHRETCSPFADPGFPEQLRELSLVVEGYGERRRLLQQEYVDGRDVETVIAQVLSDQAVRYAHLRNAQAGCFIARVERS